MGLWGITYMDVDERWWADLVVPDAAPEVGFVPVGSRVLCEGFRATAV